MANQDYTRTPKAGKFYYEGINVRNPPDMQPPKRCPYMLNVSPNEEMTCMQARAGIEQIAHPNGNPIHSIATVGPSTLSGGSNQAAQRFLGIGTEIWSGYTSFTSADTGYSGNPLAMIPYRPNQSPQTWLYAFDSAKQRKFGPAGQVQNVGIFPPTTPPVTALAQPLQRIVLDVTSTTGWSGTGGAANPSVVQRVPASTTISSILYDTGTTGWACIVPSNAASNYAFLGLGARLTLSGGSEIVTVMQVLPGLASTTVAGVAYDTGTSGLATLQPTAPVQNLQRNALIVVNGAAVRVLSVNQGPDNFYSIRVVLPSGIAAGQTITVPVSFRAFTTGAHGAAETITSQLLQSVMTAATALSTVGIVKNTSVSLDLSQIGGRPLTSEDYLHCSFQADNINNIQEVHFLLDVDATNNDFNHNYFYYTVRQNDFQQVATGGATSTTDLLNAITTGIANEYQIQDAGVNPASSPYPSAALSAFGAPSSDQLSAGAGQFYEAIFKINDLTRVGTDTSVGLNNVKAIGILVILTGNVTVQFGSWWAGGTYGPDVNYNSFGNQGLPVQYRYRYRSSLTGAISELSPATRAGELPMRGGVNVTLTASTDAQVDLIDIERFGGTGDTFHRFLTVPNTSGAVLDSVTETVMLGGDPLDLLQYQPWPTTDKPRTGVCNIVGTRVTWVSGDTFNTSWIRGVEIIVNNQTYDLYAPPSSTTSLETAENIGVLTNATFIIPEATIIGQPLPYVAGPWDGRLWATGDTLNPGLLYFSNSYNPDTASDQGYIEVSSPSEPLFTPVVYEGTVYVFSNTSLYRVDSTPGGANPYAAYKLGNVPSGLAAPWAVLRDWNLPLLAWLGYDGIYVFNGQANAANASYDDLGPLFPFESRAGMAVEIGSNTLYPPDYQQQTQLRLSYANGSIFFDYKDTNSEYRTFELRIKTSGWLLHSYNSGLLLHYQEQGSLQSGINSGLTLVGDVSGELFYIGGDGADQEFTCIICTPSEDQGDSRAQKQYGDVMLDTGGANPN